MARNNNGTYSVPVTLVPGTTARASDVNTIATDLGNAVTDSLSRSGAGGMLAPLKSVDGSAAQPGMTFTSDPDTGFRRSADGTVSFVSNGTDVLSFGARGITNGVLGTLSAGAGALWFTDIPPRGWSICNGQPLPKADYPELFAAIGNRYGPGTATHFNVPDMRGCIPAQSEVSNGNDTPSGRLSTVYGAAARTLGSIFGAATHLLTPAQMPRHGHLGRTNVAGAHGHVLRLFLASGPGGGQGYVPGPQNATRDNGTELAGDHDHDFTTDIQGGDQPHANVQPTFVVNFIIFTGR